MKTDIIFNYGSMNSGKSLELIKIAFNYQQQGHQCLILKPVIDTRVPNFIYSRTGLQIPAIEIDQDSIDDVNEKLNLNYKGKIAILIEESNFLKKEVVDVIIDFSYKNNVSSVMFFGLKNDFRGNLFEGSKRIIERSDKIIESTSICWCGKKARQNARVVNGEISKEGPTIMIEDGKVKVDYVTLCNYHYALGILNE